MPEISRYLGIVIAIYYNDHPPMHFHAKYGEYEATVNLQDGSVEGQLPARARRLVLRWFSLHRAELITNWNLAQERKPLIQVDPLE